MFPLHPLQAVPSSTCSLYSVQPCKANSVICTSGGGSSVGKLGAVHRASSSILVRWTQWTNAAVSSCVEVFRASTRYLGEVAGMLAFRGGSVNTGRVTTSQIVQSCGIIATKLIAVVNCVTYTVKMVKM